MPGGVFGMTRDFNDARWTKSWWISTPNFYNDWDFGFARYLADTSRISSRRTT